MPDYGASPPRPADAETGNGGTYQDQSLYVQHDQAEALDASTSSLNRATPFRRTLSMGLVAVGCVATIAVANRAGLGFGTGSTTSELDGVASTPQSSGVSNQKGTNEYYEALSACPNYDDDTVYPSACTTTEDLCSAEGIDGAPAPYSEGSNLQSFCGVACGGDSSFGMACAWEAVAALPSVCGGSFKTVMPTGSKNRDNSGVHATLSTDLLACDEHAFCYSCSEGNPYCEAVAMFYGGVDGGGDGNAYAAVLALNANLSYWCSDDTMAAIESGYGSTLGGVDGWSADDRTPGGTTTHHDHTESCGKGCTETVEDDDTTFDGPATPPASVGKPADIVKADDDRGVEREDDNTSTDTPTAAPPSAEPTTVPDLTTTAGLKGSAAGTEPGSVAPDGTKVGNPKQIHDTMAGAKTADDEGGVITEDDDRHVEHEDDNTSSDVPTAAPTYNEPTMGPTHEPTVPVAKAAPYIDFKGGDGRDPPNPDEAPAKEAPAKAAPYVDFKGGDGRDPPNPDEAPAKTEIEPEAEDEAAVEAEKEQKKGVEDAWLKDFP
eukprot:CAMPEP_0182524198 /NCGR_PEP_ID=MMETSP1323-20130603/1617_1 /TAXON_ID=236787 /ORGANISM="Florenciella parvula, Strain RCC1693" /LENGTH=547 /DNA_ID=CAMNT_0024732717 /DNA_START=18 /DNA_END=1661 /DNA_ORIENTATION=+